MGISSLFRGLFGGGSSQSTVDEAPGNPVDYKGFVIRSAPRRQGSNYLTAGIISRSTSDGTREHRFIRADTHASIDDARSHAISKAQRIIDEQGERLFRDGE